MKKSTPISLIMTKNLITLNENDDLMTAESLFKKNKIRHIPVVRNDEIIGMLSYTDLLRISFADGIEDDNVDTTVYNMFSLDQVMIKKIETVSIDATVKEVAEILAQREFHALPVLDKDKLVGIITTTDLVRYLIAQL